MFTFEELCNLIRVVSETGVGGVEVERDGMRVRVDGVPAAFPAVQPIATTPLLPPQVASAVSQLGTIPAAGQAGTAPAGASAEPSDDGLYFVTSPIVGTFYRSPNPDADPYCKVGDAIHKGQVLCIVEAMKLMNEIESDTSGTIVKIYPENAQPVEFGERLFAIRPD
jgi:acetyl-CoA carboxylase biotin carboxyl carrier protein